MSRKRLFVAAVALTSLAVLLVLFLGGGEKGVSAASAGGTSAQGGEKAAASQSRPGSATRPGAAPGDSTAPDTGGGKVFVQGAWGTGPDQFGRHNVPESNPEGPLTISVDGQGNAYVLDQVNGRILRFDKDGKPLEPFALTQQAPHDVVVTPTGTTLVMDQIRDKSIAVLDSNGKLIGELPVTGKHLTEEESGLATGIFADTDGVYVEKAHAMQYRVGDAAGNVDPNQPLMDGRPSRDGQFLLSMGMSQAKAGRFWVRAMDRSTGQMRFMREYTLPNPIMMLSFLDSDASGRIYAAAHVGRELPINPADGGYGGGFTDESVQFLCLDPSGEPRKVLVLPANTMAEESVRDLAVREDGTILYMHRSEEGLRILQYSCA